MTLKWPVPKDPNATKDYEVDWSDWLGGDTISASSWTLPAGITQQSAAFTSTTTTIFLSGGTEGNTYQLLNRITTAGGRSDDRTVELMVSEQ